MAKQKKFSLASRGLKYKLNIAFYLMSVLPLLVCIYLVSNYILPHVGLKLDITAFILISVFIALAGFYVIKEIFNRSLSITAEAKLIAAGDFRRRIDMAPADELSDLGQALNQLAQNIGTNMDELKSYGDKTAQINFMIQKYVLTFSSLLQMSSLVTQGVKLEDILKIALEKSKLLADSDVAYLLYRDEGQETFYVKAADGINSDYLLRIKIEPEGGAFDEVVKTNRPFILDKENLMPKHLSAAFYEKFRLKNTLAQPVYLGGRVVAILGIGNTKETFSYRNDDIELLDIFAKQVAIAVSNDILIHQVKKLEIKDALTGLYNEAFIHNCLQEEIKRAIMYRRPCAFILLNIDNFQKFHENFGLLQAEVILKRIASLIKGSVTEIDRVARSGDNEFAIVLPEKNKRQAQKIAEDIRKKIDSAFSKERNANMRFTVSGGVSENPLDGVNTGELITKAKEALNFAKTQGKNRIGILSQKLECP